MRITIALALASLLVSQFAFAGETCESKAVSKAGKPLAGAAKTAFMKKCEGGAAPAKAAAPKAASGCAEKALSKAGKPLAGAAKTAFMKKCEADAVGK